MCPIIIPTSTKPNIKRTFDENLKTDTEKLVYDLSDGKSSPFIASTVGIDPSTVRDYWRKWADAGMMEVCPKYKRRFCKLFSLGELGIEMPDSTKGPTATEDDVTE